MRAHARISLHALRHNLQLVRELAPDARIMSVIKANAYGHGMLEVARALDDSDSYAVATLNEAIVLRNAGIDKDICVLQGASNQDEFVQASQHAVAVVVHSQFQLAILESMSLPAALDVWLKIDTGMHRLGIEPGDTIDAYERLQHCNQVQNIRIMSHFANADDPGDELNARQLANFLEAGKGIVVERSIANSAAICASQAYHLDWVRPGIMLYGVNPFLTGKVEAPALQAVMTLSSRLLSVQNRKRGDTIGYGATWTCPEDMPVGIVSIGYGDGYPRHARSATPVLINGIRVPLIGRVSMDMISIDLRDYPQAAVGDEVILWGDGLPVEEVALCSDTIAYELLCKLTSRVEFSYS
jgi:alanine racemase